MSISVKKVAVFKDIYRYRIQAPEPVGDEIIVEVVPDIRDLAGVKHALVLLVLQK